jgi:hypothetical protein
MTLAYAYLAFVGSSRLVMTTARWAAALVAASVAYVLVMLLLAALMRQDTTHAAAGCAAGMAVAVPFAGWVASAILLPAQRRAGVCACTLLAVVYPLLLAASSAPGTPVRTMQFLYAATAAAGGIAALWALPITGNTSNPRNVREWLRLGLTPNRQTIRSS